MKIQFVNDEYQSNALSKSIFSIMEMTQLCSIATVGPSGEPHINTAFFSYGDTLEIYFLSDTTTKHCQNIKHDSRVALTIFNTKQSLGSGKLRGLQLFGQCDLVKEKEGVRVSLFYAKRFLTFSNFLKGLNRKDLKEFTSTYKFYAFRPKNIKIFDEPEFGEETFVEVQVKVDSKTE